MGYRVRLNANQLRSFDEQVAEGTPRTRSRCHVLPLSLSAYYAAFTGVKVPLVEGMSERASRMKVLHESRRHGVHSGAPFPKAVQATWHEPSGTSVDAPCNLWKLTASQFKSYKLLKEAGHKQLLTFLSGEGGMGKSLLIRLLVQHWRSQGKRVLVCAASAKAARLIGGHTVHSAFQLRLNGGFLETQLNRTEKHNKQWAWLFTRDIIIIDEISMLTAGALHGVNHALNHAMSLTLSKEAAVMFGGKSILAVGDLFQLPAVERFRFSEQAQMRALAHYVRMLTMYVTLCTHVNRASSITHNVSYRCTILLYGLPSISWSCWSRADKVRRNGALQVRDTQQLHVSPSCYSSLRL